MAKFSIIIPVYNVEKYLSDCMNSLINQTYGDIEIICVNDGSEDNSLGILESFAQNDGRIKIINQENKGVSAARNTGLENATGEYVLFVDSDDWLEINACEKINSVIAPDIDIVFCNGNTRNANGSVVVLQENNPVLDKKNNFFEYIEECFKSLNLRSVWGKAYSREYLKKNNIKFLEDLWFGEDTYFLMCNMCKNPQIYVMEDCLYNYRIYAQNSLSKVDCVKRYQQQLLLLQRLEDLFNQNPNSLLEFCAINDTFRILTYFCKNIPFTNYKKTYLASMKSVYEKLKSYNISTAEFRKNVRVYKRNTFLIKTNIFELYWKIIRPTVKHLIVLPYRKIKRLVRGNKQ